MSDENDLSSQETDNLAGIADISDEGEDEDEDLESQNDWSSQETDNLAGIADISDEGEDEDEDLGSDDELVMDALSSTPSIGLAMDNVTLAAGNKSLKPPAPPREPSMDEEEEVTYGMGSP